jgi:hypothetical protein
MEITTVRAIENITIAKGDRSEYFKNRYQEKKQ